MMSYFLGIDLGTTYTAAAVHDGSAQRGPEMVTLGERGPTAPSVLWLQPDGRFVAGDAAERHAVTDPARGPPVQAPPRRPHAAARRRQRHPGRGRYGAALRWVVDAVVRPRRRAARQFVLTHPANWGPYKRDLLEKAAEIAGRPQRRARDRAAGRRHLLRRAGARRRGVGRGRLRPGGGTFDAAVLRKEADGGFRCWAARGHRAARRHRRRRRVFATCAAAIGDAQEDARSRRPQALGAVARLREECTAQGGALARQRDPRAGAAADRPDRGARHPGRARGADPTDAGPDRHRARAGAAIGGSPPRPTSTTCCWSAGRRASRWCPSSRRRGSAARWPSTPTPSTRSRSAPPSSAARAGRALRPAGRSRRRRRPIAPVAAPAAPSAAPPRRPADVPDAGRPAPSACSGAASPVGCSGAPRRPRPPAASRPHAAAAAPGSPAAGPSAAPRPATPSPRPGRLRAASAAGLSAPPPGRAPPSQLRRGGVTRPAGRRRYRGGADAAPPGPSGELPPGYLTGDAKAASGSGPTVVATACRCALGVLVLLVGAAGHVRAHRQCGDEKTTLADVEVGRLLQRRRLQRHRARSTAPSSTTTELFDVAAAPDPQAAFPADTVQTDGDAAAWLRVDVFYGAPSDIAAANGLGIKAIPHRGAVERRRDRHLLPRARTSTATPCRARWPGRSG